MKKLIHRLTGKCIINPSFLSFTVLLNSPAGGAAPLIRLESPAADCVLAGDVSLSVAVTDSENSPARIEFRFSGPVGNETIAPADRMVAVVTNPVSGINTVSCSLQEIPSGTYVYYVDAIDAKGITNVSSKLNIRVGPGNHTPKMMVDDDFTHIMNIPNAYNEYISPQTNGHLNLEKITAAVTHIATNNGIDTYVFCPGVGEVLFYKSDYYSLEKHEEYWERATFSGNSLKDNLPYFHYIRKAPEGLDRDPIDDVRDVVSNINPDIKFFVSIRMNDAHLFLRETESLFNYNTMEVYTNAVRNRNIYTQLSFFRWLHPEASIGDFKNLKKTGSSIKYLFDYSKDWTNSASDTNGMKQSVYHHKLEIMKDVMKNHRMDGIMLDFMRLPYLFNPDTTTSEERRMIMISFISDVRKYADGAYRNLYGAVPQIAVRIPFAETEWDRLGIDIRQWALAGVDIFVMSSQRQWYLPSYFKDGSYTHDYTPLKALTGPGVHFTAELTYNSEYRTEWINFKNTTVNRRTTDEQLLSGAYLNRQMGADGLFLFNFPYYETVYKDVENSVEPYRLINDMTQIISGEKICTNIYYYIRSPHILDFPDAAGEKFMQLPVSVSNKWQSVKLYAPKPGEWPAALRMRVEADSVLSSTDIEVKVNGVALSAVSDSSEPYVMPFQYGLCIPANTVAFAVPGEIMSNIDGTMNMELRCNQNSKTIRWIEITAD